MLEQRIANLQIENTRVKSLELFHEIDSRPIFETLSQLPIDLASRLISRYSARESYFAEWCFVSAFEDCMGVEVATRDQITRILLGEVQRVKWSYEYFAGLFSELGDHYLEESCRSVVDSIYQLNEVISGSRIFLQFLKVGGLRRHLNVGEIAKIRELNSFVRDKTNDLFSSWRDDFFNSASLSFGAVIHEDFCNEFKISGPIGQGSGLSRDLRIDGTNSLYKKLLIFKFHPEQDHRCLPIGRVESVRFQLKQSIRLIEEILTNFSSQLKEAVKEKDKSLPSEPQAVLGKPCSDFIVDPVSFSIEAPSGEMTCFLSDREIRIESISTKLRPMLESLFLGIDADQLGVSFQSLGYDFMQGDLVKNQ